MASLTLVVWITFSLPLWGLPVVLAIFAYISYWVSLTEADSIMYAQPVWSPVR